MFSLTFHLERVLMCLCCCWLPDEFEKYCSDVEHTAAWGGQLEVRWLRRGRRVRCSVRVLLSNKYFLLFQLQALTQVLQMPIKVLQADSAIIKIGEEFDSEPITLVYITYILVSLSLHAFKLCEQILSDEKS